MSNQQDAKDMNEIRRQVAFGIDAKAFMQSNIGVYLQQRANNDIEVAMDGLATVDPTNTNAIRALQNDIKCAGNFLTWMAEAVTEGESAEFVFIDSNSN
jgi:hypothetical protein